MAFYYDFERNDKSAASLLKTTSKSDFVIANNFQQLREGGVHLNSGFPYVRLRQLFL